MSAAARLAELHAAMDRIREALERDQIEAMPPMLDAYDRAVDEFCRMEGAAALREGVQALHERQQQVIAAMRVRQDRLQALMRQQRQANRAVHAYAGAR
ncbi:hypothetical protein EIM48_11690 [Pseudoxanthomonas sp. SGNA-20]|jgi:hypothetical protein|uniref:Flagellar protein FliT n=1 Tax=Pseudoxanthomonas taiwanensis J19 TaxID=935569 RepID=A0A562DIY1_9GAMM|nr:MULTISPECIES: hypothetical protein [Pseudoxanthomonas]RRN55403.1 hypothetical protein EIM48_11690 [Pseudoxanthomonas sp. SGNA-20]TWH09612.1 hypothetical protein L613_003500000220 [Pseudoxanthomonas taiwanensis J19]